jgi:hypothetical protein
MIQSWQPDWVVIHWTACTTCTPKKLSRTTLEATTDWAES